MRNGPAPAWLIVVLLSGWAAAMLMATERPSTQNTAITPPRFGLAAPLPRTPGSVRLAAYNTLNLFDQVDDPTLSGEFDDIKESTPPARLEAMAKAIRQTDADIIALSEVESLQALMSFRDAYLKDAGYKHLASEDVGYYRGVECSVMSRFPIVETKVWLKENLNSVKRAGEGWASVPAGTNLTFQRSPLMVTVQVDADYQLTIFALHHKAGRDFNHHREAEAIRINELVREIESADPSRNIVVMGDFNAAPWDKSFRVYLASGLIDSFAHRTTDKNSPESRLFKTHESDRVLDYILLNSAARRELIIGRQFVLGTITPPQDYNYLTDQPPPGYASDHYPVVLELRPDDLK